MKKLPKKILIVDDDAGMIRVLQKWLKVAGYATAEALDGYAALDKIKSEAPDLILLDVLLPDLNGTDVAKQILQDPATSVPMSATSTCTRPSYHFHDSLHRSGKRQRGREDRRQRQTFPGLCQTFAQSETFEHHP